jgi:hypothetical protein
MTRQKFDPNMVALKKLIASTIAKDPFEYDGHVWCALPQPELAASLGASVETLRRLISKPPIIRDHAHRDGKVVTVLRVGDVEEKTKKQVQKHLANIWAKHTGRTLRGKAFGHFGGMVDAWGLEKAPEILTLVLKQWPRFMAGAHIEIEKLGDAGHKWFFEHPSTSVILRFNSVAIDMLLTDEMGKHGLNADTGGLWFAP